MINKEVKPLTTAKKSQGINPPAKVVNAKQKIAGSTMVKPSNDSKGTNNTTNVESAKKTSSVQSSTKSRKEEKIVVPIQKTAFVRIELNKTREMVKKLKELEDIQKINAEELTLDLQTYFESEADMVNFTLPLAKIANKIHYLNWTISGQQKDEGSMKSVGELISKCTKLYHLKLKIISALSDNSVQTLSLALKKLPNLRILQLFINQRSLNINNRFSVIANNKLIQSIDSINKLEVLDYNGYNWLKRGEFDNLLNFVHIVYEEEVSTKPINIELNVSEFQKKVNQIGTKIIDLNIQNDYGMFKYIKGWEEPPMTFTKFNSVYQKLLPYVAQLPYLTNFSKTYYSKYEEEDEDKIMNQAETIIHNITKARMEAILQITYLQINCLDQIPINPCFIISDLYL